MARYTGPACRFCRREGAKLYLKGERCYTDKCSFERKPYAPGVHGKKRAKMSDYALQLREKQKVRRTYGLLEKAFAKLFHKASRQRGVTADTFFRKLELRLDNTVFRMGFACSRQSARQLVTHNHFLVNNKPCNVASRTLALGDVISVCEGSRSLPAVQQARELFRRRSPLAWIDVDEAAYQGKVVALPQKDDIQMSVKDHLIVELYSK